MSEDLDIPAFLRMPAQERADGWKGYKAPKPPTPTTGTNGHAAPTWTGYARNLEPAGIALLRSIEGEKARKKAESLEQLKEWKAEQPKSPPRVRTVRKRIKNNRLKQVKRRVATVPARKVGCVD